MQEFTNGQALVLPVIEDVDQIYIIDCAEEKSAAVDTTAEAADTQDQYITINAKKYSKAAVIAQLKVLGAKVAANASDDTVIKAVNALSDEDEKTLFSNLTVIQ